MTLRFDDRVAIVTGAGAGLGRTHALDLAKRGAKLVINDLGGTVDGSGGSATAAEKVVEEIREMGGDAIANDADVTNTEQVKAMVDQAMSAFGRIDILINNAGILRDASFHKVSLADFEKVLDVHLVGSVICTHTVWPIMREAGYGRILMTTSPSGLYGNFGQSNYGAAKMGLIGLMNTLKIEGAKYNLRVNALSPVAATRMTESLMPPAMLDVIKPEIVTPAAVFMVSEDAPSGDIIAASAGGFTRVVIAETEGAYLGMATTADDVAAAWGQISDLSTISVPKGNEKAMLFLGQAAQELGVKL